MTDISVIILQKDEAPHIKRCLSRLAPLEPKDIFVVDCYSTDGSDLTAEKMGATVIYHKWPRLYATQFQWALDNLPIKSKWVLRLDADEYLTLETIEEIKRKLNDIDEEVAGISLRLKRVIFGGEINHATNDIRLLRIFRVGRAGIEQRAMDEHIKVDGQVMDFDGAFYDHNLKDFEWWKEKHRGYAKREAKDAIEVFNGKTIANPTRTDRKKIAYYSYPIFIRPILYFILRYFVRRGFLDGVAGFKWNFWQGFWYRWIVDVEICRLQRKPTSWSMEGFFWILGGFLRRGVRMGAKSAKRVERPKDRPIVVVQVLKTLGEVYGGPSRAVQGLTAALEEAGVETHLVSIEGGAKPWVEGIKHYHAFDTTSPKVAYEKMVKLIKELNPDFVHTNDCWMPILDACNRAARDCGVPYLLSPHGSLKRWSRNHKKIKKWFGLKVYQGYNLARAVALNTTSDDEYQHVAELGYNANVLQVTNGLSFPTEAQVAEAKAKLKPRTKKRAIFLSRIHYTKGLMNLVEAWAKVRPDDWEMEIVGTDADGYQAVIEARVKELGLEGDFIFSGAVDEAKKWEKYYNSDLFVLPTFTENFGIVVAEALYAGVPAITTKGAPWGELESEKCGWWIEVGVEPLVEALRAAFQTSPDEMRAMGERGHNLVVSRYSWKALGEQMKANYERLLR